MHRRTFVLALWVCLLAVRAAAGQEVTEVALWPGGAPGAVGEAESDRPRLFVHTPAEGRANGSAIVIFPGGGYGGLAMDHEGVQIARWFNERGFAAYILRYRHAPAYRHPIPLTDAKRALRHVRHHAAANGIQSDRIGVMGFSAGGHLASTLATHFDAGDPQAADPIERVSCRPDFLILCYPVITFLEEPYVHKGSRRNLLGENPPAELVEELSNERQVFAETPPTFLFHTSEDAAVPPENSILFYQALRAAKVPAELHIYRTGGHGVGLAQRQPLLAGWPGVLENWLKGLGVLEKPV